MDSSTKTDLARAGTMELTTKEGRAFLEKNLTEWKKPLLIGEGSDSKEPSDDSSVKSGKKGAKKTSFEDTDDKSGEEVPEPSVKKAKLEKASTMAVTAKEGKELLGGRKLGDTRQVTKAKQKSSLKRATTMQKVVAEATAYGYGTPSGERALRKRRSASPPVVKTKTKTVSVKKTAPKKAALKKAGTMLKTAKEGKRLIGEEQLGDTRQVTKQKQKQKK